VDARSGRLRRGALGRNAGELGFEPGCQCIDLGRRVAGADAAAFVGRGTANARLNGVELGGTLERFGGDRRGRRGGGIE